jgi:ATP-dependent protease ClpP protease subunit
MGSPADFREYADLLDGVSDDISQYYADRAGGKAADWRAAMTATTWYNSSQAVEAKLADRVAGSDGGDAAANRLTNRSRLIKARARVALGGVK